jgi:ketosteroid isomerase-like protein
MTGANVEVVRRAIGAVNRRALDDYLELCSADVELFTPIAAIEGPLVGPEGIRQFFAGLDEGTSEFRLEVEHFEPVGSARVLAFGRLVATSETGLPLGAPIANVYDLADGKLRRIRIFRDAEEARAAAASPD